MLLLPLMGKTSVRCSRCKREFKPGKLKDIGSGAGGGAIGWVAGSSAGVALLGTAYVASAPAAVAGTAIGVAASSQFTRCPHCKKLQTK